MIHDFVYRFIDQFTIIYVCWRDDSHYNRILPVVDKEQL